MRGTVITGETGDVYCCNGCLTVASTLRDFGLGEFYRLRDVAADGTSRPAKVGDTTFDALDDPRFLERAGRPVGGGMIEVELLLEGAHCAACVFVLEQLPRLAKGVAESRLELPRGVLRVVFDPRTIRLSALARLIERLGYPPHPLHGSDERQVRRTEERAHVVRFAIAFVCFGNAMLFAFALYGDLFAGMPEGWRTTFRLLGFACAAIALAWPGRVFLRGAVASLRSGAPHMDLPVALALVVGTTWGGFNAVRGVGEVYFESLTAVIFLLSVGRYLQFRQRRGAADAIDLLYSMTPRLARRVVGDRVEVVPVDSIRIGDVLEILPGSVAPADGVVSRGESECDFSVLTGESLPRRVGAGDSFPSGATNLVATLHLEVTAIGAETRLGRLLTRMRAEAASRAPIVRVADRAAVRLVKVVLVLAALTFAWWARQSVTLGAEHAIALLIVTCPCALGLATPLAIEVALGRAARRGILVNGGDVVERLAAVGTIVLDKTGTLTCGQARLVEFVGDRRWLDAVAALERDLPHPYARAFVVAASTEGGAASAQDVNDRDVTIGGGVSGTVDGMALLVGNAAFVTARGVTLRTAWADRVARLVDSGLAPVFVAADRELVAVGGMGDPPRPAAQATVAELRRLGLGVELLSGDHPAIVSAVGGEVGIPAAACEGGATPERKLEAVAALQSVRGAVAMVGDGVNDAAALARADVGIAIQGGAEASLAAADVYLASGRLEDLPVLVRGARRTLSIIRGNLAASLFYNMIAGTLAIAGLIHPLVAAVLMPLSSLTVVALSFKRRTFDSPEDAP